MNPLPDKPYLTAKEVAELLMVSTNSVRVWTDKGMLRAETTLGGHRRFPRAEIEHLMKLRSPAPAAVKLPSVLIIDDEQALAETLADGLREALPGIRVETAHDGFEGGLKASATNPDIILLDLMMPGLNGFEVCRLLKREPATRHVRVIAITGFPSEENVQGILQAGAERCLAKPLRISALVGALGLALPVQGQAGEIAS